ncbi:hypothetical protein HPB50_018397 [Hyalomma asiaticum]|uniref:Uncharacterized protein n=1 Tax=Hyalomma asiaticum TaxID=266040 RepID=A0ACB7SDH7_HYAAI|nr:hypothetical protein HPB50_018397 [Hyalomma asiaticum]
MNGDGAVNLHALGVADSEAGGQDCGTSDTASEQQLALLQLQLKIAEAETEKHRLILESQRLRAREGAEPNDGGERLSLGGRLEEHRRLKFASLLKGVLAPLPNQDALVPMWFEDVEATLDSYKVPAEWWSGLVLPQLSERARGLLCRLKAEERKVYSKLKSSILDDLKLTTAEYKRLFMGSRKGEKESWDQFAVRLENYFDYYVPSSKVRTFEELKQLAVTDHLKEFRRCVIGLPAATALHPRRSLRTRACESARAQARNERCRRGCELSPSRCFGGCPVPSLSHAFEPHRSTCLLVRAGERVFVGSLVRNSRSIRSNGQQHTCVRRGEKAATAVNRRRRLDVYGEGEARESLAERPPPGLSGRPVRQPPRRRVHYLNYSPDSSGSAELAPRRCSAKRS